MMKVIAAGLAAFVLLLAGIALTANEGTQAQTPTDTPCPTDCPTDTPAPTSPAATSPAATSPAATSPAATTAAAGTATPTPSRLPAAAPQTGGDPGSGSDTVLLTLIFGAAAIIGVGGVFAGKYALDRRS
jgi:hypothetical protein